MRFQHLRMDWDGVKGEWVQAEKRYFFTTVCRQVAGELGGQGTLVRIR